ncbi:hypothetical protein PR202_ga10067 [Eleusine coracana subsp. coracana]|uniref:Glutathione S-transferase n=1 Tax=Eleusine coracana subsp. coracana TaxID=191504 RepID=A0AAV5C5R2_ELECO|nr:hypothetical protein PR202_ga10067 [Eleusine coracana subsp. coracana]
MATGGELQLLGSWYSPYVIRAKVALGLKGIRYEYIEQDLFDKSDLLMRHNPVHKKVPVLMHGGKPVCESLVIVQYIHESWTGTAPRLDSGQPMLTIRCDTNSVLLSLRIADTQVHFFQPWRALMRSTTDEQRDEAFKRTIPHVETLERAFWECSKGNDFFNGDTVGLVDITLGSFLLWFMVVDEVAGTTLLDDAKFPGLAAWAKHFLTLDVVKRAMPDVGKLLAHYKIFLAKLANAPTGNS